jgi:hypothetical protein
MSGAFEPGVYTRPIPRPYDTASQISSNSENAGPAEGLADVPEEDHVGDGQDAAVPEGPDLAPEDIVEVVEEEVIETVTAASPPASEAPTPRIRSPALSHNSDGELVGIARRRVRADNREYALAYRGGSPTDWERGRVRVSSKQKKEKEMGCGCVIL